MLTKKAKKATFTYFCKDCDFYADKKQAYTRHISTRKHKMLTDVDKKSYNQTSHICVCGKEFSARQSLSRHKKTCFYSEEEHLDTNTNMSPDVILELLKQNQEFKNIIVQQQEDNQKLQTQLMEVVKEGKNVTNTTNNTTNNNKFNLNFFLNEQCKNAMNISEFINNIVLSVEDLKTTGKLGYIDGISKIFADKLRELDTYERPMHCTDLKRETLYIKNNNEWSKDTEDKRKIKTAIECVANKNLNNLDAWKEENPNHVIMDSKEDKEFVEIMTNSLGGMGSDREKNKQKIIKNVLKEITVEK